MEAAKKALETIENGMKNDKLIDEIVTKVMGLIEKAKTGSISMEELEKIFNQEATAMGVTYQIGKDKVEKAYARLTGEKAKTATKDDVKAFVLKVLADLKAQLEEKMKQ